MYNLCRQSLSTLPTYSFRNITVKLRQKRQPLRVTQQKSDKTGNIMLNSLFIGTLAPEIYWRRDTININFRYVVGEIYERYNIQNCQERLLAAKNFVNHSNHLRITWICIDLKTIKNIYYSYIDRMPISCAW